MRRDGAHSHPYIGDPSNGGAFMLMVDDFFVGQADYFSDAVATKSLRCAMRSPYIQRAFPCGIKTERQVGETDGYSFAFDQLEAGQLYAWREGGL